MVRKGQPAAEKVSLQRDNGRQLTRIGNGLVLVPRAAATSKAALARWHAPPHSSHDAAPRRRRPSRSSGAGRLQQKVTDFSHWLLIPFGHVTVDLGAGWQELVLALVPSFAEGQEMARDEALAPPGDARLSLSGGSLRMRAFVVSGGWRAAKKRAGRASEAGGGTGMH